MRATGNRIGFSWQLDLGELGLNRFVEFSDGLLFRYSSNRSMANISNSKSPDPESRISGPDRLRGLDGQMRTEDGLEWGHAPGQPNADHHWGHAPGQPNADYYPNSVLASIGALNRLSRQGKGSWYDPIFRDAEAFKCYLCGDKQALCLGGACHGQGQGVRHLLGGVPRSKGVKVQLSSYIAVANKR